MNASETRRRGRKVAAGLAAVALIVIVYAIANRSGPTSPNSAPPTNVTAGAGNDTASEQPIGTNPQQSASGVRIEVIDEETGRLSAIMTAERIEPIDATNSLVTNPQVRQFLDGGQMVFIRADEADIHRPAGQEQPDRGTMRGNVQIRLFDPMPIGYVIDVDVDEPVLVGYLKSLKFDLTHGEISTEHPIRILGDEFEMQGVGMEWLMNLAESSLNSMSITKGRFARYIPFEGAGLQGPIRRSPGGSRGLPSPGPTGPSKTQPQSAINQSPDPAAPTPVIRMYLIEFLSDVKLTRGPHVATADRLSLWVRTIDNALPEGAVPQMKDMEKHTALPGVGFGPELVRAIAAFVPTAMAQGPAGQQGSKEPVSSELRWTGPMIVTPIEDVPVQLSGGNHVYLDLSSDSPNQVVMRDTETGAIAKCASIQYAATNQVAVLVGEGELGVDLFSPDPKFGDTRVQLGTTTVDLAMGKFDVDGGGNAVNIYESAALEWSSDPSGDLVMIDGRVLRVESNSLVDGKYMNGSNERIYHVPGELVFVNGKVVEFGRRGVPSERVISWGRHASGDLVIKDGKPVGVERALLEGSARIAAAEGFASGDELDVQFSSTGGAVAIQRVVFTGNALAGGVNGESLAADWIEAIFDEVVVVEGEQSLPSPNLLTARGNVVAKTLKPNESTTRGDSLVAELAKDGEKIIASRAEVDGNVIFEQTDRKGKRQTARADRLVARPDRKLVDLFGSDDAPARVTYEGARIDGPEIRLDGKAQSANVFGAGQLVYANPEDPEGLPLLDLFWSIDMAFDNGGGIIDGRGNIHAVISENEFSYDTIDAHRLRVLLVPADDAEAVDKPKDEQAEALDRIRRFDAWGSVLYEENGLDAIIKSRLFGEGEPGMRPVVRAMDLSGARIIGERVAGENPTDTLSIPGRGRLMVMDETRARKDGGKPVDVEKEASETRDMRGAALFDWDGNMSIDRRTGTFEMNKNVLVSHKRTADESVLYLEADSVTGRAEVTDSPPDPNDDGRKKLHSENRIGDLQMTIVSGNVYARWQGRELQADRLVYDAEVGTLRAESDPGSRLTIMESANAAVVHATTATWNIETGEAQMEGVRPIVVPVGALPETKPK